MSGWDGAGQHAAAENYAGWASLLEEHPKVLWGLIADVVKAVKASEGEKRTGRRPAASVASLDELYEVLFPQAFSTKPFKHAFADLLEERWGRWGSQTAFAVQAGLTQPAISKLISGRARPSVELMERLAYVLGVKPTIFSEYRALKIGQVVADVLGKSPEMSIKAVRDLMGTHA